MTPKYNTYPKYKSSGVDWLGDIPEGWEVIRLGRIGKFTSSGIDKILINNEPKVKIINYTDVYGNENHIINNKINFMVVTAPKSKIKQHQVRIGDLIFTPSSETIEDIGVSAVVFEKLENTAFSYHVLRFQFQSEIFLNYKKYLCNNSFVLNQFSSKAQGTTRQTLDRNDFKTNQVILPPLAEQEAIANFLDDKTEKIDRAIKQKEQLIELLKERKQIIIQDAVTKGLDSSVKMKDSGVEWIGDIPAHWVVKRLKYVGKMIVSNVDKHSKHLEVPVKLCNYVDVYKNDYITNNINFMNVTATIDEIKRFDLKLEDVIITKDSEDWLDIGVPSFVKYSEKNLICGYHLAILRTDEKLKGHYLFFHLLTNVSKYQFNNGANGVTRYCISHGVIKNQMLIVPPLPEQEAIVEHIEEQSSKIDKAINLQVKQIDKLKEYKSILIDNAVTGKIKVM